MFKIFMDFFNKNLSFFSSYFRRLLRVYVLYSLFLNAATNPNKEAVLSSTADVNCATPK
jgi:hypothetical protein